MRRRDVQRGAVAVTVALVSTVLLGFAALSVDVAGMLHERQQLQIGADAAALAIALDCSRGDCGNTKTTAQVLAAANVDNPNVVGATTADVTAGTGKVTVVDRSVRSHLFAPAIGIKSSPVGAQASARWGSPGKGTAKLPVTFSYCEWLAQTGGGAPSGTVERTIRYSKDSGTSCNGPSGNAVPGGFGWFVAPPDCRTPSAITENIVSKPGNSVPSGCSVSDFAKLVNTSVLLPIYDSSSGQGNNAVYHVYAYAAFVITGYSFVGQYSLNVRPGDPGGNWIRGYFTSFVDPDEAFNIDPSAPSMGASIVNLSG